MKAARHRFLALALLFISAACFAQDFSLMGKDRQRTDKKPTVIKSDTMDIDSAKNTAVFTGNVKVDDQELTINCHKMTIYLEDVEEQDKDAPDPKKTKKTKKVSKIICEKDVVIVRKPPEGEEKKEEQKATAGRAEYDVKEGKITLTENPVLLQGEQRIEGEVINFWRDSERLSIQGGSQMRLKPETLQTVPGGEKRPDAKPKQERPEDKKPAEKTPAQAKPDEEKK